MKRSCSLHRRQPDTGAEYPAPDVCDTETVSIHHQHIVSSIGIYHPHPGIHRPPDPADSRRRSYVSRTLLTELPSRTSQPPRNDGSRRVGMRESSFSVAFVAVPGLFRPDCGRGGQSARAGGVESPRYRTKQTLLAGSESTDSATLSKRLVAPS